MNWLYSLGIVATGVLLVLLVAVLVMWLPGSAPVGKAEGAEFTGLAKTVKDYVEFRVVRHERSGTCYVMSKGVSTSSGASIIQVDPSVCESYDR